MNFPGIPRIFSDNEKDPSGQQLVVVSSDLSTSTIRILSPPPPLRALSSHSVLSCRPLSVWVGSAVGALNVKGPHNGLSVCLSV